MVTWLDEEHRRDKAEMAQIQQRLEAQALELEEQNRRLRDIEEQLIAFKARLTQYAQLEKALEQTKSEIVLLLEQYEEKRQQAMLEADRLHRVERENLTKTINEMRKELQAVKRHGEELEARKAEDKRLSDAVLNLQERLTEAEKKWREQEHTLAFAEEQRRHFAKRIARLQQENTDLIKRVDELESKFQYLSAQTQNISKKLEEVSLFEENLRQEQRQWLEAQQAAEQERARQMGDWAKQAEEFAKRMEEYAALMDLYAKQYERNKKALERLETLEASVKSTRDELYELHKVSQERQKKEWEEFREEMERRWKHQELQLEHQWKRQDEKDEELATKLQALETSIAKLREDFTTFLSINEEGIREMIANLQRTLANLVEQR